MNMSSSDTYIIQTLDNIYISLYQYVLPIFYVLGNIGNLLSASVFLKHSWRKKVCVFYFNICLLFNSCYINSYILGSIFTVGYNINIDNSNVILCKLFFYVGFLFSTLLPTTVKPLLSEHCWDQPKSFTLVG
jgi:hypothetical protein